MDLQNRTEKKKVLNDRKRMSEKLGIPLANWIGGRQSHGTNIEIVGKDDSGKGSVSLQNALKSTDGIITKDKNILLTAYFADCVPIYFFDPVKNIIGIVHAGWRGTIQKITKKMVEKFTELGAIPSELLVVIGPCISRQSYEVSKDIIQRIDREYREKTMVETEDNRFFLDLKKLNVEILLQSGVLRHNIDMTSFCTYSNNDLFFSYRRDKGKTGRMLGYIGMF